MRCPVIYLFCESGDAWNERQNTFAVNNITCVILLSLFCNAASAVEFNTDVLDAADKKNIDFTRFSEAGYVLPGQYLLDVIVNGQSISPASLQISFVEPQSSGDKAEKNCHRPA